MWGAKDEWNFYIQKKAPVVIQKELSQDGKVQWSIDVKETLRDIQGPMTLDVKIKLGQAISFCKHNQLAYQIVNS